MSNKCWGRWLRSGTYLILLGCFAACLAACGSGPDVQVRQDTLGDYARELKQETPLQPPLIVVTPPLFSGSYEPYEVHQKTYDLISEMTMAGVPVVAPWEYKTYRPSQNPLLGSNVSELLARERVKIRDVLRVEVQVVMLSGQSSVHVSNDAANLKSMRNLMECEIRLTLRPISDDRELVSWVVSFEEDPMSDKVTEYDRYPALAQAIRYSAEMVSDHIHESFPRSSHQGVSRMQTTYNPKPMFHQKEKGQKSLAESFASMDMIEAAAHKMRYYQYFDPDIPIDQIFDFEAQEGGIFIKNPGPFASHGLQEGDYVKAVGQHQALGVQVIARPFLRGEMSRVSLTVDRNGQEKLLSARDRKSLHTSR